MTRITAEQIAELRGLRGCSLPWRTCDGTLIADAADENVATCDVESIYSGDQCLENARLIVAAVNALPRLLDRIEELESGLREACLGWAELIASTGEAPGERWQALRALAKGGT